jgi:hypothetical protein
MMIDDDDVMIIIIILYIFFNVDGDYDDGWILKARTSF